MLMELKRPAEAFKEYEASQQREPNRYRGLYGAGQAGLTSLPHVRRTNRVRLRRAYNNSDDAENVGTRRQLQPLI